MDIQAAIDALPPEGGVVHIPIGTHTNNNLPLSLRSGVTLQGENRFGTIIPPIRNGVIDGNGVVQRIDNCSVRDVTTDGRLAPGYYGIYWYKISRGDVTNVNIWYSPHGLVVRGPAYYNTFSGIVSIATDTSNGTALEFYEGANQNTVVGGVFDGKICLNIVDSNGITILGSSLETGHTSTIFKQISGDYNTTSAIGVRQENPGYGPVMWNT